MLWHHHYLILSQKNSNKAAAAKKHNLLGGGLPPVGKQRAEPTVLETTPKKIPEEPKLSELQIAQNEADTAFSGFMDDLEKQQNPEEPFIVKFGTSKGEKKPTSTSAQDKGWSTDPRILLLIAPDAEGSFTLITRQGPKEIKPKDPAEAKKVQDIIDHCLTYGRGSFVGGLYLGTEGKAILAIGYDPADSKTHHGPIDSTLIDFDSDLLSAPSDEAVIASIQASREFAHARAEEKQNPLRDAREQARKSKESARKLSDFLKNPPQSPAGEGPATPLPPTPTTPAV